MAKFRSIYIDVYKRNVYIFIGEHQEFIEWCKDFFKKDEYYADFINYINKQDKTPNLQGTCWFNSIIGEAIIELPKVPKNHKEIATAVHECLHAVFHILDYCGVERQINDSGESYTYLLEYITSNLLNLKTYNNYDA